MSDTDLLTTAQAGERLGIAPTTLTYWRTKHCGPRFVRMGEGAGRVRYRPSDLDEYAAANVVDPAA